MVLNTVYHIRDFVHSSPVSPYVEWQFDAVSLLVRVYIYMSLIIIKNFR